MRSLSGSRNSAFCCFVKAAQRDRLQSSSDDDAWALEEIRAGRPLVVQATQDLFVPQMVNLERLGGVDFKKGCYPGQEIVARTQYRGVVKRRMVRAARSTPLQRPGQELYATTAGPGERHGGECRSGAGGRQRIARGGADQLAGERRRDPARRRRRAARSKLLPLPYCGVTNYYVYYRVEADRVAVAA